MTSHRGSRLFRILPVPFWCYMIPMAATTVGWLPASHPFYSFLSQQLLPVCLVLLLIGTDLRSVARLGPLALRLMLIGSAGTLLGGLISFWLYRGWLPEGTAGAVGALAGSWIGGSANLIAVKEALRVPDPLIAPIIVVDAVVAYSWMGLLIWSSGWQEPWNRMIATPLAPSHPRGFLERTSAGRAGTDPRCLEGWGERGRGQSEPASPGLASDAWRDPPGRDAAIPWLIPSRGLVAGIVLAMLLSWGAQRVAAHLPTWGSAMGPATWTVLLVTTGTLLLSLTPLRKLEAAGVSRVGTFALYLLLASIGARTSLQAVAQAPVFLALGLTWIGIHGLVLLAGGLLLKAPLGLIATASQANIGGPISAPIVGATFSKELAGIGLLMAVLGNLLGTYLGLAAALAAKQLAPF